MREVLQGHKDDSSRCSDWLNVNMLKAQIKTKVDFVGFGVWIAIVQVFEKYVSGAILFLRLKHMAGKSGIQSMVDKYANIGETSQSPALTKCRISRPKSRPLGREGRSKGLC